MNSITRFILKTYAMELIFCFLMNIIGYVMMAFSQDTLSCNFFLAPSFLLGFLAANTSMLLSVSRCYVKKRAVGSKFVNPKSIITCIKNAKIICYVALGIIYCCRLWFKAESLVIDECANVPFYEKNSNPFVLYVSRIFALVFALLFLIQFFASIASELTLKRIFDARRHNKNNTELTLWSDVGENLDSNQIPLKSTYISLLYTLFGLLAATLYTILASLNSEFASKMTFVFAPPFVFSTMCIFHLPIILRFMFNYEFAGILLNRQPPSTIQFHDVMGEILDERSSENGECTVNPAQQSAIFTIKVSSKNKYRLENESRGNTVTVHHNRYNVGSTLPSIE